MSFRAVVLEHTTDSDGQSRQTTSLRELDETFLRDDEDTAQPPARVLIDVAYSSLNYKDAMALTGRPGVAGRWPLIPGIDLVGTVMASDSAAWRAGDSVILNGDRLGETRHGGMSERALVRADALVAVPPGISQWQAAAIGTAGFTAMLSVLAAERHGVTTDNPVLVTGASGGVGSLAIALLARLGYTVTASTGRADQITYLHRLGATEVVDRHLLSGTGSPLQKPRWGAVIDSVGSYTLANALAQTRYGGVVTACGLAQGSDLPATVLPFILRGVTLAGINSVDAPLALRRQAWERLATDLDLDLLESLTTEITLAEVSSAAQRLFDGGLRGRTVITVHA